MGEVGCVLVGYPSSSTSGWGSSGGWVGWGEEVEDSVGERRCLEMGGGAASSSLEESSAGADLGGGCLEWIWQREKKLWEVNMEAQMIGVQFT